MKEREVLEALTTQAYGSTAILMAVTSRFESTPESITAPSLPNRTFIPALINAAISFSLQNR
jgi:hypothetical protein